MLVLMKGMRLGGIAEFVALCVLINESQRVLESASRSTYAARTPIASVIGV